MSYVIALDQGGTQVRAALVDAPGNAVLLQGAQLGGKVGVLGVAALVR